MIGLQFLGCLPSGHITWWFQELQLDDSCVCFPHEVKGLPPISSAAGGDVHSLALDETGAGPEGGEMEVEAKHKLDVLRSQMEVTSI